jgi:hypothetical protein
MPEYVDQMRRVYYGNDISQICYSPVLNAVSLIRFWYNAVDIFGHKNFPEYSFNYH